VSMNTKAGMCTILTTFYSVKCQTSPNGKFCFGPSGGSFTLGHPGGAFNGETWNPFPGAVGTPGGLLVGSIGSPNDIATIVSGFAKRLRTGGLDQEQLHSILDEMQDFVSSLKTRSVPIETQVPKAAM
jgi:hypothetical protein